MTVEYRGIIDYLRFTVNDVTEVTREYPIEKEVPCHARYVKGHVLRHGIIAWENEPYARQGSLVTFAGEALAAIRNTEGDIINPLLLAHGSRNVSRVDLAVDVWSSERGRVPPPAHYKALFDAGQVETRARAASWIDNTRFDGKGESMGATLQIGNRQSGQCLRIYDKAQELGIPDTFWTRFELEVKQELARACVQDLLQAPEGAIASDRVRAYASFQDQTLKNALAGLLAGVRDVPHAVAGRKKTELSEYLSQLKKILMKKAAQGTRERYKIYTFARDLLEELWNG